MPRCPAIVLRRPLVAFKVGQLSGGADPENCLDALCGVGAHSALQNVRARQASAPLYKLTNLTQARSASAMS